MADAEKRNAWRKGLSDIYLTWLADAGCTISVAMLLAWF